MLYAFAASVYQFQVVSVVIVCCRSHGYECYMKNSGMYNCGACRRIGEQCESHWATVKQLAGMTRYMGVPNRIDFLDDHFGLVAAEKSERFPVLLSSQFRACTAKAGMLAECAVSILLWAEHSPNAGKGVHVEVEARRLGVAWHVSSR